MKESIKFFLFVCTIAFISFVLIFIYFVFFLETEENNKLSFSPNDLPDDNPLKIKKATDNSTLDSKKDMSNNKETSPAQTEGNTIPESQSITEGCKTESIFFALKNFNSVVNCEELNGEVCIKKTINCTLLIENLDSSIGGLFKIRIAFLENKIKFQEIVKEKQLSPKENVTLSAFIEIESNDSNGRANQNLSCDFNSIEIPQREVCY